MADNTKIAWTDATWNCFQGCVKKSEGCKYCYMFRDKAKYGQDPDNIMRSADATFFKPLRWKEPKLIFTCSWSDFFIEEADPWRDEAWDVIRRCPHHIFQILTKRPENIKDRLPEDWGDGWDNVWIGVTVENQERAQERIPILGQVPAKVRFLSCEPLLEEIDLTLVHVGGLGWNPLVGINDSPQIEWMKYHGIDWVIIGGESGNDNGKWLYRPCEIEWFESIIAQCKQYEVLVFMKQLGTHLSKQLKLKKRPGDDPSEWPEELKIFEFPSNPITDNRK